MHVKTLMPKKSLKAFIIALALVSGFEANADAYSRISLKEKNTPIYVAKINLNGNQSIIRFKKL